MGHTAHYDSPLGGMLLFGDAAGLAGAWFDGAKHFGSGLPEDASAGSNAALDGARRWLDAYFEGRCPDFLPALCPAGTAFQKSVWALLLKIPYGQTTTYGALARQLGRVMSPQAVGGAVGRNKISIIVPCHRVVGGDGRLTGYAGGTDKKAALLRLEGVAPDRLQGV